MSDYEVLKECKQAYEILNDLKDNCPLLDDIEDTKSVDMIKDIATLNKTMEILNGLYQNAYELITSRKDTYGQIETNVKCPRCNNNLVISDLIDYAYLCNECDENYYYSECEVDNAWWLKEENKDYLKIAITEKVYDYLNNVECDNDKQMRDFDKLEEDITMINKIVDEVIKDLYYHNDLPNTISYFVNKAVGGEL